MNVEERFWSKVDKTDTCWLWTAAKNNHYYGVFTINGKNYLSHRVSYEMLVGQIPEGLHLDHLCRVTNCVNPAHLEPVTHKENIQRGISFNSKKTHCPNGHPYDMKTKSGRRCRQCRNVLKRGENARRKARQKALRGA